MLAAWKSPLVLKPPWSHFLASLFHTAPQNNLSLGPELNFAGRGRKCTFPLSSTRHLTVSKRLGVFHPLSHSREGRVTELGSPPLWLALDDLDAVTQPLWAWFFSHPVNRPWRVTARTPAGHSVPEGRRSPGAGGQSSPLLGAGIWALPSLSPGTSGLG